MTFPLVALAARRGARAGRLRQGSPADAAAIQALITEYANEGRLLPRRMEELRLHAARFLVVEDGEGIVACGELTPLSPAVAEIRSLVVHDRGRGLGFGRRIVTALVEEAQRAGFARVCVFTHQPGYFVRLGFSLVPHRWVPEKIAADCAGCALFQRCGQSALEYALDRSAARARAVA